MKISTQRLEICLNSDPRTKSIWRYTVWKEKKYSTHSGNPDRLEREEGEICKCGEYFPTTTPCSGGGGATFNRPPFGVYVNFYHAFSNHRSFPPPQRHYTPVHTLLCCDVRLSDDGDDDDQRQNSTPWQEKPQKSMFNYNKLQTEQSQE